jgi:hypothetical protein
MYILEKKKTILTRQFCVVVANEGGILNFTIMTISFHIKRFFKKHKNSKI